jgi:hypothetical protein
MLSGELKYLDGLDSRCVGWRGPRHRPSFLCTLALKGAGKFQAFSAGTEPKGRVHPMTLLRRAAWRWIGSVAPDLIACRALGGEPHLPGFLKDAPKLCLRRKHMVR